MAQQKDVLAGKVAVITGSTQGLGLATARSFAGAGAAVVVSNHLPEDVARAVDLLGRQGARVTGHVCDVRERAQAFSLAEAALSAFGRLDIWVNNAGVTAVQGPTVAVPPASFLRVVETNILGTYHGSLAALRHMAPARAGKLINIVGQGEDRPNPYGNAYGSSKAWIRHFTMGLAKEEHATGVGIFTLNPGLLDTELTRRMQVVAGYESRARAFDTIARLMAVPPEESARLALHLAGPATDGRTGIQLRAPLLGRLLRGLTRELARLALRRPAPRRVSYVSLPADDAFGAPDRAP
ncbi:SDR family oxidoreductase [Oscillochloris sp. ZM17-4]|uniref:SDR family NAD(P)-dependent oxidoreductase n=1 Tax=Oscillochloris sp. ZM17-4 TaxID=2866714 RepID=UPI001C72DA70|nr:SDR family oxidoreductase [Oscillochloris sp. ZM17-4]MBX0329274.1 SDR family oxidoreductase [Oscillochloris sp. ZM17-4]